MIKNIDNTVHQGQLLRSVVRPAPVNSIMVNHIAVFKKRLTLR